MNKKTKTILITLIIILVLIGIAIAIFFYFKNQNNQTNNELNKNIQQNNNNNNNSISDNKNSDEIKSIDKIRVAHWNVLNQSGTDDVKNEALAKIILKNEVDVIALTEINAAKNNDENDLLAVQSIVDLMNLYTKKDNANLWSYSVSRNLFSVGNETQAERVAYIYRNDLLKLKNIDDQYVLKSPNNKDIMFDQYFNNNQSKPKIAYSRPLYGTKFTTINDEFDFTLVAGHFDSPGASKNDEKQDFNYVNKSLGINISQGSKELNEAYYLANALKLIDEYDGNNNDIIFMGDTNIKEKNENGAFAPMFTNNFVSLLKDSEPNNKTSLSNTYNKWSQPYDKIFVTNTIKTTNSNKYDLWNTTLDGTLDDNWKIKYLMNYKKTMYNQQQAKNELVNWETQYITNATKKISDHTLIYVDVIVDKEDISNEKFH